MRNLIGWIAWASIQASNKLYAIGIRLANKRKVPNNRELVVIIEANDLELRSGIKALRENMDKVRAQLYALTEVTVSQGARWPVDVPPGETVTIDNSQNTEPVTYEPALRGSWTCPDGSLCTGQYCASGCYKQLVLGT